jgi:hypothetical protein
MAVANTADDPCRGWFVPPQDEAADNMARAVRAEARADRAEGRLTRVAVAFGLRSPGHHPRCAALRYRPGLKGTAENHVGPCDCGLAAILSALNVEEDDADTCSAAAHEAPPDTPAGPAATETSEGAPCSNCGHGENHHNSPIANGRCEGEWERCGCREFRSDCDE